MKLALFGLPVRNGAVLSKSRERLTNPLLIKDLSAPFKTPSLYKATNVKYAALTGEGILTAKAVVD